MVGTTAPSWRPLYWWSVLVCTLAVLMYVANYAGHVSRAQKQHALYEYSTAVGGVVQYAILIAAVLAIARSDFALLALRRPESWTRSLLLAVAVFFVAAVVVQGFDTILHGGREQGLVPDHWQPAHAGAFAANWIVVAGVAPVVEELTYRGLGYSLVAARFGRWPAIVAIGVLFALGHGFLQAIPELATLGCALAWLRSKTGSVFPGMIVHGAFNSLALVLVILR